MSKRVETNLKQLEPVWMPLIHHNPSREQDMIPKLQPKPAAATIIASHHRRTNLIELLLKLAAQLSEAKDIEIKRSRVDPWRVSSLGE